MRFLKGLRLKQYCNELHYTLVAVILLFFSFNYSIFIALFIVYIAFMIYKKKQLILMLTLVFVFILLQSISIYKINKVLPCDIKVTVIEEDDNYVVCHYKGYKILLYTKQKLECGDVIDCNVSYSEFKEKAYSEDFDVKAYYHSKGIYHVGKINTYQVIDNRVNINTIKYKLIKYYQSNLSSESFMYFKTLFLGTNDFSDELKDAYSLLGISHILAISGLHINMLYTALVFIFRRLFRIHYDTVPIIIIGIYVIIIGFPVSCLRALIYLIIKSMDYGKRLTFTRLDILSISFIIILLLMPYSFYQTGFQLTFLVSFLLCFSSDLIKTKSKLIDSYLTYFLIMLITLPIISSFNNYFSLTAILLSPILTIAASFVLVPLAFIMAIPMVGMMVSLIATPALEFISKAATILAKHTIGFGLTSFSLYTTVIYYVIYFVILISISKKKPYIKYIALLFMYLVFINCIGFIDPFNRVAFIAGGQGDSTLITLKNNQGNILIDAYESYEYLKKKNISKLDYLILTHSDSDHISNLDLILDNIEVNKIIISKYDDGFLAYLDKGNFIQADNDSVFTLANVKINILAPIYDLNDKNANSLVSSMAIDGYTFLFCGDINEEVEGLLVNKYKNKLKSDVLKVPHHGSKTSSSAKFINIVNPDYSIIFAEKNNIYGFPHSQILDRLARVSKVYQTGICGNIDIVFNSKKFKISGYRN